MSHTSGRATPATRAISTKIHTTRTYNFVHRDIESVGLIQTLQTEEIIQTIQTTQTCQME